MNRLYVIIISLFVSVCAFSQTYTLQSNHLYQTSPRSPIEQDYPRPFSKSELFVSLGIGSYYLTIGNSALYPLYHIISSFSQISKMTRGLIP
ncbi:MAG: hypothetical protein IKN25_02190, partial [Spirochaetales bacterium]|nr:hypothetical protein [Spirochaetales bacterium]